MRCRRTYVLRNNTGYHIPMSVIGESEKVTAVLKLLYFFLNAWSFHF